ncbi:MAG: alpha/beta hydrolase family protein [Solirubrobacteraceae bacterium]
MATGVLALAALGLALALVMADRGGPAHEAHSVSAPTAPRTVTPPRPTSYAVGLQTLRLVEPERTVQLPNGESEPRTLLTYVRYPALGAPSVTDRANAPPASADGPFPLVIFGHGFAVMPALYQNLLQSWARAGFVVAAPVFPLENANAPGGPKETDLINQPADMRFLISQLLNESQSGSGPLAGLINPSEVAVSGQSDGGDTALAVGYDRYDRDPRVTAVMVLSGAELPGLAGFEFAFGDPPLLATQGTADTVNKPAETDAFFELAQPPKYLLSLLGADHLGPYSSEQPQLGIVERVTIAFLRAYVQHEPEALHQLLAAGRVPGVATLQAEPTASAG